MIGLCASSLSDICSNSLRVLKTTKQTTGDVNINKSEKIIKSDNNKISNINESAENILKSVENKNDKVSYKNTEIANKEEKFNTSIKKANKIEFKDENNEIEVIASNKSYIEIAKDIIAKEGLGGLFGRGLQVSWKIYIDIHIFISLFFDSVLYNFAIFPFYFSIYLLLLLYIY